MRTRKIACRTLRLYGDERTHREIWLGNYKLMDFDDVPVNAVEVVFRSIDEDAIKMTIQSAINYRLDLMDIMKSAVARHFPDVKVTIKNLKAITTDL